MPGQLIGSAADLWMWTGDHWFVDGGNVEGQLYKKGFLVVNLFLFLVSSLKDTRNNRMDSGLHPNYSTRLGPTTDTAL